MATLSHNELKLCDLIFDLRTRRDWLVNPEEFGERWNFGWPFQGGRPEAEEALLSLIERGLVEERGGRPWNVFGFTFTGGRVWEKHRQPDWQRYVLHCGRSLKIGLDADRAIAFNLGTLESYLEALDRCRLRGPVVRERHLRLRSTSLLYWRAPIRGLHAYIGLAQTQAIDHNPDWKSFQVSRAWWSMQNELWEE